MAADFDRLQQSEAALSPVVAEEFVQNGPCALMLRHDLAKCRSALQTVATNLLGHSTGTSAGLPFHRDACRVYADPGPVNGQKSGSTQAGVQVGDRAELSGLDPWRGGCMNWQANFLVW
jgi:hypothetical protein